MYLLHTFLRLSTDANILVRANACLVRSPHTLTVRLDVYVLSAYKACLRVVLRGWALVQCAYVRVCVCACARHIKGGKMEVFDVPILHRF